MANFENLIENKQNFIRLFLEDEELVKCLGSTRTDFLNDDVDPESLL